MRCAFGNLISAVPVHRLDALGWMQAVPLRVLVLDVELAHSHDKCDLDVQHGQGLTNAIARAMLEWSPSAFRWI